MVIVDNVYQKVLAIANKEQRGYITPQEFNLFADQAQMEIFEQYFYDIDQFERRIGSDIVELLQEKISLFQQPSVAVISGTTLPMNMYKVDSIYVQYGSAQKTTIVERVDRTEVEALKSSSLFLNELVPVYYIYNNVIYFHPHSSFKGGQFIANLIRKPVPPKWTYLIGNNQSALWNPNAADHSNFELHISEENNLVIKILQLAGISMKDYGLAQLAGQKEVSIKQEEKQ